MTENISSLTINYRVKCGRFKSILGGVMTGRVNTEDADVIMNLHLAHYVNTEFKKSIKNNPKTMHLFSTNQEKDKKNAEQLIRCSKDNKVPVARLDCWFDTNKLQTGTERHVIRSHFNRTNYAKHPEICVRARVATKNVNLLLESY